MKKYLSLIALLFVGCSMINNAEVETFQTGRHYSCVIRTGPTAHLGMTFYLLSDKRKVIKAPDEAYVLDRANCVETTDWQKDGTTLSSDAWIPNYNGDISSTVSSYIVFVKSANYYIAQNEFMPSQTFIIDMNTTTQWSVIK